MIIQDLTQAVQAQLANSTGQQIKENLQDMLHVGGYGLYQGKTNQQIKPAAMVDGFTAFSHEPQPDEVLITRAEQSERGWLDTRCHGIRLSGNEGAKKLFPILRRLGSLYTSSGATSTVDQLDISKSEEVFYGFTYYMPYCLCPFSHVYSTHMYV